MNFGNVAREKNVNVLVAVYDGFIARLLHYRVGIRGIADGRKRARNFFVCHGNAYRRFADGKLHFVFQHFDVRDVMAFICGNGMNGLALFQHEEHACRLVHAVSVRVEIEIVVSVVFNNGKDIFGTVLAFR